ncbi:MAG: hypothetical protein KIH08_16995 [Candidatus Freyarchaeota archaeon]|nr:hypothetical protein [Candidatus Jordarchaeia archaeon]
MEASDIERVLERVKGELVGRCVRCGGVGFVGGEVCGCMLEYRIWNRLLGRGFSEEFLRLSFDEVLQNIQLDEAGRNVVSWFISNFEKVYERGLSLYIHGKGVGVGKTSLAVVLVKEYLRWALHKDYKWDACGVYSDIESFLDRYIARERGEVDESWDAMVFVLDEFGREVKVDKGKDWLIRGVERFLRYRLYNRKSTIIVSNLSPGELFSAYGEIICSLIGVVGGVVSGIAYKDVLVKGVDLRRSFSRWEDR